MNIGTIGYAGEGRRLYAEIISKAISEETEKRLRETILQDCEEVKETSDITQSNLYELMIKMAKVGASMKELSSSFEILTSETPNEPTIDQLKKQIKYSKNPLEVKMLNKKLNQMYKDMKRR